MLLILAIVFCHAFVRFVLAIARGPIVINRSRIPSQLGPGGYAEPERPIPVVLPADEESMAECEGGSQEKLAAPPPAYGLWRSSVVSLNSSLERFLKRPRFADFTFLHRESTQTLYIGTE